MSDSIDMSCADAERYLSMFADGELAEPLRAAVFAHVATCDSCGEILAQHQAVNRILAGMPASAPSPAVLDRVLMARVSPVALDSVQRESMRRRGHALTLRRLPALLAASRLTPAPALTAPRSRSFWQATALPALAAVLLISFAFVAFNRVSPNLLGAQTAHTATPTPRGDAYQQAQAAVLSAITARPITFSPEVPWNLPPGATFQQATVDSSGSLDIAWSLSSPLAQLHVRESPVLAAAWNDYHLLLEGPLTLAWQLPGKPAWDTGSFAQDTNRLAVMQGSAAHSVGIDVTFPGDTDAATVDGATQTEAANVLRLASLSMDSPRFTMPALVGSDAESSVVRYIAESGSGADRTTSNVYVDAANDRARVTVSDGNGKTLYDDYIVGTGDTRYDPQRGIYGPLPTLSAALGDAALDPRSASFFTFANSYLADGSLWYIGKTMWNGANVYQLALTTAPYRATIYVDTTTNRVLGATVDYSQPQNANVSGLPSPFSPSACLRYTTVEYLSSAPAGVFVQPNYYTRGSPRASATCAP